MRARLVALLSLPMFGCAGTEPSPSADRSAFELRLRSGSGTTAVRWEARKTAFVVCDMWDDHWCKGAAARVGELAGPMNRLLAEARRRGAFIVHAPSSTVAFYKDHPARRRAQWAPFSPTPVALSKDQRWETAWCWPDKPREPALPIDDSDMGCACPTKCEIRKAWSRQIAAIEIDSARDAISDDGQEAWNLLQERGVENVVLLGVHLNMCVLGRPFAIRQMVKLGKKVALVRDMTDTMYDPRMPPGVDHFAGTDLVVGHIERHWCPSFASSDVLGGAPFRFREDRRP
jgi:nicotinamidase-related amidase